MTVILALDNIRSAYNVGSILRTAEAFGVKEVVFGGITPDLNNSKVKKTSLGAENSLKAEIVDDLAIYLQKEKKGGRKIVSLEINESATDIKDAKVIEPFILVIGNEVSGIARNILSLSDHILKIPMRGKKESLNVSTACGIALYELTKFC